MRKQLYAASIGYIAGTLLVLTFLLIQILQSQGSTKVYNIVDDFGATCNGSVDDAAAFAAFNTAALAWQAGHPSDGIELDIPVNAICEFKSLAGNNFANGIKKLMVDGLGAGATRGHLGDGGTGFFPNLAGQGEFQDNTHSARVQTVTGGSSSITTVTPGQGSLFTADRWVMISGIDMQGFGYPANPGIFQYKKILTVVGDVVTFTSSLQNTCKSTWPVYNAGGVSNLDFGGPCTLYALPASWDTEVTYRNLIFDPTGQMYAVGRSITFVNVDTPNGALIPTQNSTWTATDCNFSVTIEMDKTVETVTLTNTTAYRIDFQSTSIGTFSMAGGVISDYLHGTPMNTLISGATVHNFATGAWGYGVTQGNTILTNTVLPEGVVPFGFTVSSIDTLCSMTLGVLKCLNSDGPFPWAVPGASLFFNAYPYEGGPFTILDLWQDATYTYISTTLTGGYPTLPLAGGHLNLRTNPSPNFKCNCTGSVNAVGLSFATARQSFSVFGYPYAGNISTTQAVIPVFGPMDSVTFIVTKPYTGTRPSLPLTLDGPFVINSAGLQVIWNPSIDLKTAGVRVVTPTTVTGAVGADSLTAPGAGTWLLNDQMTPKVAFDISGEDPSVYPSITIQIASTLGVDGSSLTITDSSTGRLRSFGSRPALDGVIPYYQIVRYADTQNNLNTSTTYCLQQGTTSCYASGVLQPTATLNLSGFAWWRPEYWTFDGVCAVNCAGPGNPIP